MNAPTTASPQILSTEAQDALEAACLDGLISTPHGYRYRPSLGAAAVLERFDVTLREEDATNPMQDLIDRMESAERNLINLEREATDDGRDSHADRLKAKAEGVRLALSYAREALR